MALYPTDGDLVNKKKQTLNAAILIWRASRMLNAGELSFEELSELELGADIIEALYCCGGENG